MNTEQKLREALASMTLSMKVHPDYEEDSEFGDMVSIAEEALALPEVNRWRDEDMIEFAGFSNGREGMDLDILNQYIDYKNQNSSTST